MGSMVETEYPARRQRPPSERETARETSKKSVRPSCQALTVSATGRIIDFGASDGALIGVAGEKLLGSALRGYFAFPERIDAMLADLFKAEWKGAQVFDLKRESAGAGAVVIDGVMLNRARRGGRVALLVLRDNADERRKGRIRLKRQGLRDQNYRTVEAARSRNGILANMSHELRTPLNAIVGFAELLHDSKLGPITEIQHEYLGDILNSAAILLRLINGLVELAKVEAGRMEFNPQSVRIPELADELVETLTASAMLKSVTIGLRLDRRLGWISTDPIRLRQVLYSLLSKAIERAPDGASVLLEMRRESARSLLVEVIQEGDERAADGGQRKPVEAGSNDARALNRYSDTGFGLALTRRIVEAQGGTMGIDRHAGCASRLFARIPFVPVTGGDESGLESARHGGHRATGSSA